MGGYLGAGAAGWQDDLTVMLPLALDRIGSNGYERHRIGKKLKGLVEPSGKIVSDHVRVMSRQSQWRPGRGTPSKSSPPHVPILLDHEKL